MNFILTPPTLERRALVKIAIMLCSQGDEKDLKSCLYQSHCRKILDTVAENVTILPLPSLLKEKLFGIIEAVAFQKQSWFLFHMRKYTFVTELPLILVWTPEGTIDYKRTAEILVKDETIEPEKRFNLACIYCLEDDILDLKAKFSFLKSRTLLDLSIYFWSNYEKENPLQFSPVYPELTYYEFLFKASAKFTENEAAIRYFYLKLRPEIADNLKMQAARHVAISLRLKGEYFPESKCHDILYFLLTTMNVEQQGRIFQSYTYEVLRSLLVWPRQSLFLEVAKDKFNFLSKGDYYLLLCNIAGIMSCKHSYLREIFLEFWQQSPQPYKQFVTEGCGIRRLLLKLYKIEDERSIQVIFKDSSISAKKNLIFSKVGQDICKFLVYSEKWDSVEYLIQECLSSSQEMTEFIGQFTENITVLPSGKRFAKEPLWNKFLQMVENFIILYRKRNVTKDDNVSSKKVCCKVISE